MAAGGLGGEDDRSLSLSHSASWPSLGPANRSIWFIYRYRYRRFPPALLLQKKDSEGFGFVLRGAKAQTPIEEFTPTPAFPALQYLESVDEGGVAWRAGLRMGDFLIEQSYNQAGMGAIPSGAGLGYDRGQYGSGPAAHHHHGMLRQKSIGVPEEERQLLHPPTVKFARSLSVPGPDDIPPPPTTAPPDPPFSSAPPQGWRGKSSQPPAVSVSQSTATSAHYQLYSQTVQFTRPGGPGAGGPEHAGPPYPHAPPAHTAQSRAAPRKVSYPGEPGLAGQSVSTAAKAAGLRRGYSTAGPPSAIATVMPQQQQQGAQSQAQRGDRGAATGIAGVPKGGPRRGKVPLVKQSKVDDLRAGQGTLGGKASVEKSSIAIPTIIADGSKAGQAAQPPAPPSTPAPAPPSLPSIRAQDGQDFTSQFGAAIVGAARRDRERFHEARRRSASFFMSNLSNQADVATRLRPSKSIDEGMFSAESFVHSTRSMPPAFGLPEYSSPALDYQPKSVPADFYGTAGRQLLHQQNPASTTTFIHPLTGKVLDPSSPLGLALAARERALKDDSRLRRGADHHFTRQMSNAGAFPSSSVSSQPPPISTTAQSSGSSYLVTSSSATPTAGRPPSPRILRGSGGSTVSAEEAQPPRRPSYLRMESEAGPYMLSLTPPSPPPAGTQQPGGTGGAGGAGGSGLMVLPPPAPSVDADDEFVFADPLPPPLEFANTCDRGAAMARYAQRGMSNSLASAGDSATSSLTSYDSEVANLTQSGHSPSQTSPNRQPPHSPSTLQPTSVTGPPPPPSVSPPPPPGSFHRPFSVSHPHHLYNSAHLPGRSSPTPPPLTIAPPPAYRSPLTPSSTAATLAALRGSTSSHATTAICAPASATSSTSTSAASQLHQDRTHNATSSAAAGSGARRPGDRRASPTSSKAGGESQQEAVVDSGIEELDSRSSSDHHLDSILGVSGVRGHDRTPDRGGGERTGRAASESERGGGGGDLLDSYMSYLDGQTFEMQNATAAAGGATYPKPNRFREGGRVGDLRRQTSTAPPSFHAHRRRGEPDDEEPEEGDAEDDHRGPYGSRDGQNLGRPSSPYFDRPRTPEMKPLWGDGPMAGEGQAGAYHDGRRMYQSASSMKPSILNELSSKLQQRSKESWSNQRALTRHRFSEDSASALSPPSTRSLSPSPISLSQPALSPSPTPSSQYQNWARSTSPQPAAASQPPRSHSPLSPTSYAPYPTSPKHRPVYRTKALEFQFIPSRETRKADSHIMQRRRAPSPLISPSERPKAGPPRPSSLPLLPTTPLYSALYDLRGSVTPPYPHLPPPSPTKPFASKPLPYWTKYDVADWLVYLNLAEHRERFLDNEIDGTHLPSLTKEDYLDLGVTRVGHRMNIERALRRVVDRMSSSPFPMSILSPRDIRVVERRRDDGSLG
ncbi:hypothetical protein NHX12_031332 [Muraenolepis orangiensis]|uniref:SAM domain-containing protein n=1 Tax=Muraenolepis orangiensis TaxID=630683 RepID=A0A9Q0E9F3_9TELE|nr:hypothetical protein NHX12_031332 [Muraenolepis orangiensis]